MTQGIVAAWHRTHWHIDTVTHYQQGTGYNVTVAAQHSVQGTVSARKQCGTGDTAHGTRHTGKATETAAVIKVQFRMLLQSTIGDLDIITGYNICVPCEAIQMIAPK